MPLYVYIEYIARLLQQANSVITIEVSKMCVSVNLFTILYNSRRVDDIELKIETIDRRMMANAVRVQNGQISLLQGHVIEKQLQARKHDLEAEREARKNILERTQKAAKDNIKKSFSINVTA